MMTNGSYRIVELIILKNNYRNLMIIPLKNSSRMDTNHYTC